MPRGCRPNGEGTQRKEDRGENRDLARVACDRLAELVAQKDSSELLLIAEPILGLRKRRSERLCDGFLRDRPSSLDGRERDDAADCAHADECSSERNNQSNGEFLAGAHGGPPSF